MRPHSDIWIQNEEIPAISMRARGRPIGKVIQMTQKDRGQTLKLAVVLIQQMDSAVTRSLGIRYIVSNSSAFMSKSARSVRIHQVSGSANRSNNSTTASDVLHL